MGLDMYLTAEKYLGTWDEEEKVAAEKISAIFPLLGGLRVKNVEVELMYWRKANQIHEWFVTNCQDGEDKCQEVSVEREKLVELVSLCKQILEAKGKKRIQLAETLLRPASGFFFGSTEIDDYYFEDLRNTITQLEKVLALNLEDNGWYVHYRASW